MCDILSNYGLPFFAKFHAMCFSKLLVIAEKIFDFRPLIVALTLNVGT